ncbi:hypothetical protein MJT46_001508 [Ovis ammon polii x Ovis aries]|nr:hypothetical protein MJT46_001508 [Ovis ammon polii x Ovis aries]
MERIKEPVYFKQQKALTSAALATTKYKSSFVIEGNIMRTTRPSSAGSIKILTCTLSLFAPVGIIVNKIDNKQVKAGDLEDNWAFLPPRKIKDPYAQKPRKWDEQLQIEDPEDKKPEDWEDFEYIPDPDTKKPDDWNEAMDGEWEGPLTPNLKYKGQWEPRIIDNSNYEGEWIHPEIDNPEYKPDPNICHYYISVLGLDLWQNLDDPLEITEILLLTATSVNYYFEIPYSKQDVEKQWRELYEEMEKRKREEEAKKKEEREYDIWGIEEEGSEDSAEEPGNDRQLKEDDDERAFLGENVEVHVDWKDEL